MSRFSDWTDDYEEGAEMTAAIVERFKLFGPGKPLFKFMPQGVVAIGGIDQLEPVMCLNDHARALVKEILAEAKKRGLEEPTVLMLQASLDHHEVPYSSTLTLAEIRAVVPNAVMVDKKQRGQA